MTTEKGELKMKKFNNAEVVELSLDKTENGLWDSDIETNVCGGGWNPFYLFTENDSKKPEQPTDQKPVTPADETSLS